MSKQCKVLNTKQSRRLLLLQGIQLTQTKTADRTAGMQRMDTQCLEEAWKNPIRDCCCISVVFCRQQQQT
jgi:hypothetical protein